MIVTFDVSDGASINGASNPDAKYMNFLRCVTAACTAAAGTTSLTVNPWTSTTALDTSKNCIVSIDANTEGGGWTTSASHNVVNTGSFTSIASNGSYTANYKADFYQASNKASFPFLKLSFHIPNTGYNNASSDNVTYPGYWNNRPTIVSTYGCSTQSNWGDNGWNPTSSMSYQGQTARSVSSFWDTGNTNNSSGYPSVNPWYMTPASTQQPRYRIAVTADYCIIWELNPVNSYSGANGINQQNLNDGGNEPMYYYRYRAGSIVYHGTRDIQPWEGAYADNPAWCSWSHLMRSNSMSAITSPSQNSNTLASNYVAAWMRTQSNDSVVTTPSLRVVADSATSAYVYSLNLGTRSNNALQTPIFMMRQMDANSSGGSSSAVLNPPQADPDTGLLVPAAYPIIIRSTSDGAYNAGGRCRGIYKSLSMPWANMKTYWTAENQTFNINGEPYMPLVIRDDMWLVRLA